MEDVVKLLSDISYEDYGLWMPLTRLVADPSMAALVLSSVWLLVYAMVLMAVNLSMKVEYLLVP